MSRKQLIVIVLLPVLLALGYLAITQTVPKHDGLLTMTAIDVGQGDSIFLRMPNGKTVLIDGGGHNDSMDLSKVSDVGEKTVLPFLRHEGVNRVDLIILTHPHGDHVGGLSAVVRALPVGRVLDGTVLPCDAEAYRRFIDDTAARRVPRQRAVRGMRIQLGEVAMDVLNPPGSGEPYGTEPNNDTVNNYSTVVRVTYGRTHLMLTGDAQTEAEDSMIEAYPNGLQCDVLKCGHHGAHNATSDEWLSAVRPSVAVISCAAHNRYGHPAPQTMAALVQHHVTPYITARDGAVTVTSDGSRVTVTTERERSGGK
ncbi:MAG TPA: ComEC/Rec2 family competence protein [Capsulimonadaceae bacterium]|jgi:competence protein ComEC